MEQGWVSIVPMNLLVVLAASHCSCFKIHLFFWFYFFYYFLLPKWWPDNAASKPLGPHHPAACPMRCDTSSLTYVTPREHVLTPRLLAGDLLALWGAWYSFPWVPPPKPYSHLGSIVSPWCPSPPWAQGCRTGSSAGSVCQSPRLLGLCSRDLVVVGLALSRRRKGAGVGERGRFGWKAVRFRSLSLGCCVFWQSLKNADLWQPYVNEFRLLEFRTE